jgi:hypothetical protein
MFTTTLFDLFLWPSSHSCTVYFKEKVYQVEASPLQAMDTTISSKIIVPNSVIILK